MTPHPAGGAKVRSPLIEFHQGSEARSTYGSRAKRDVGYLQSLSLKDENRLWATMCKLKQETTECFAANVGRNGRNSNNRESVVKTFVVCVLLLLSTTAVGRGSTGRTSARLRELAPVPRSRQTWLGGLVV